MNYRGLKVFDVSPPEYRTFSHNVCKLMKISPGKVDVSQFKDGATDVDIQEGVRGHDVYVFQSRVRPIGTRLDELYNFVDAAKYGGHAARVTAVLPYCFGQRGERRTKPRQPVPTIVMGRNLKANGCDKITAVTVHTTAIGSIFNALGLDFEHLEAEYLIANYFINSLKDPATSAAPDVGGSKRSRKIMKLSSIYSDLNINLAIADKGRPSPDESEIYDVIGDVEGRNVLLTDDIGDTLGTMLNAGNACKNKGAASVEAAMVHLVLGDGHEDRLKEMLSDEGPLNKMIISNSVPIPSKVANHPKTYILPLETFVAEAIRRMHQDLSISDLHNYEKIVDAYEMRNLEGEGNIIKIKK